MKSSSVKILSALFFVVLFSQCKNKDRNNLDQVLSGNETEFVKNRQMVINKEFYAVNQKEDSIYQYTLRHISGLEMKVISYGGTITSLKVPDRDGNHENIVLGLRDFKEYEKSTAFFGALIGRYGNRIANASFSLDNETYTLAKNDGENNLHGGFNGFDKVIWNIVPEVVEDHAILKMYYTSKDGEEGFPGNLEVVVTYDFSIDDGLAITYEAVTDKKTIVNLTQHAYFNLSGKYGTDILDHVVQIDGESYLPVNTTLIPTGTIAPVKGTPFDFMDPKRIGEGLDSLNSNEQLSLAKGFDHNWVLGNHGSFQKVATVHEPISGRTMDVYTEEPGMQFYTGNMLDGSFEGVDGGFNRFSGFCMETQHYPDSPNQADFPSVILKPGEKYTSRTTYKFGIR